MNLLYLHPDLYVIRKSYHRSTADDAAALRRSFPKTPREYIKLTREVGTLEVGRREDERFFLRIWSAYGPAVFEAGYQVADRIPGAVPIGDNGNCEVLLYVTGMPGEGIYLCPMNDLGLASCRFVAKTLKEVLYDGQGFEAISPRAGARAPMSLMDRLTRILGGAGGVRRSPEQADAVIQQLGVHPPELFTTFFRTLKGRFWSERSHHELLDLFEGGESIQSLTETWRGKLGFRQECLIIAGLSAECIDEMLVYDCAADKVYEVVTEGVGWRSSLEMFHTSRLAPEWGSFEAFLIDYFDVFKRPDPEDYGEYVEYRFPRVR